MAGETLEDPFNCTQPELEFNPPVQGRETSSPRAAMKSGPPTTSLTPFGSRARFLLRTYRPQKDQKSTWRAKVGRTLLKIQIHLIWKEPGQFWRHSRAPILPIFSLAQGLGSERLAGTVPTPNHLPPSKESPEGCPLFFPTGGLLSASCRGGSVAGLKQGLVSAGSRPSHEVFQSIVLIIIV